MIEPQSARVENGLVHFFDRSRFFLFLLLIIILLILLLIIG